MRKCGRCSWYIKLRNRMIPGICEKHDWACDANHGRFCQDFKGVKYNRIKAKAL